MVNFSVKMIPFVSANPSVFALIVLIVVFGAIIFPLYKGRRMSSRLVWILVVSGIVIYFMQALFYFGYFVDDAFISLRYAESLAGGYGLNFNRDGSAPVEGYSNFLWVVMEVPAFLVGLEPVIYVKVMGVVLGIVGLLLVYRLGLVMSGDERVGLLSMWMVALVPMYGLWSVGGLETVLYMVLGVLVVVMWMGGGSGWLLGLVMLLVSLARNEGLAYFLIWVVMVIVGGRGRLRRGEIICGLVFIVGYIGYEVWRVIYFGDILPNTFYAKVRFGWGVMVGKVFSKASFYYYISPLMILAVGNFLGGERDRRWVWLGVVALSMGFLSGLAYREWMPGWRYSLPMVPFLVVLAVNVIVRVYDKSEMRYGVALVVIFVMFMHLLVGNVFITEARSDYRYNYRNYFYIVNWFKTHGCNAKSLALEEMGLIPFYTKISKVYDINDVGLIRDKDIDTSSNKFILDFDADYLILRFDGPPPDGRIITYIRQPINEEREFINKYRLKEVVKNLPVWFYIYERKD